MDVVRYLCLIQANGYEANPGQNRSKPQGKVRIPWRTYCGFVVKDTIIIYHVITWWFYILKVCENCQSLSRKQPKKFWTKIPIHFTSPWVFNRIKQTFLLPQFPASFSDGQTVVFACSENAQCSIKNLEIELSSPSWHDNLKAVRWKKTRSILS